jgi:hypothetical protein
MIYIVIMLARMILALEKKFGTKKQENPTWVSFILFLFFFFFFIITRVV